MITVPADWLRSCVKVISPTIPQKPPNDTLLCMRVRWLDGDVIFSSHNLSAGSSVMFGECDEPEVTDLIVRFDAVRGFSETLDKHDPDVTVSWTDKAFTISCGDSQTRLPLSDIGTYPNMDTTASTSLDPIPVELLKSTLKFLLGIPDTDVNTSMFYDLDKGIMGTTDNCEARFVRGFQKGSGKLCIGNGNSRILKAFLNQCEDTDELVPAYSDSHFNLRSTETNRAVSVRLVDPSLVRSIPNKFLKYSQPNRATTGRVNLAKLARQSLSVSDPESNTVIFSMSKGEIQITTSKGSARSFNGKVPVSEGSEGEFVTFVNSERLFYVIHNMSEIEIGIAAGPSNEPILINSGTQTSILAPTQG
jgi:hypothetical protein